MGSEDGRETEPPTAITTSLESMTGSCFCGTVCYTVAAGSELRSGYCNCKMCQKLHAAPTTAWVGLKTHLVTMRVDGSPVVGDIFSPENPGTRLFRSSERAQRLGCATCGTPLFFKVDGADWLVFTLCSLDPPWLNKVIPAEHLWHSQKAPWFETNDSWAPRYDTEPGMENESAMG